MIFYIYEKIKKIRLSKYGQKDSEVKADLFQFNSKVLDMQFSMPFIAMSTQEGEIYFYLVSSQKNNNTFKALGKIYPFEENCRVCFGFSEKLIVVASNDKKLVKAFKLDYNRKDEKLSVSPTNLCFDIITEKLVGTVNFFEHSQG